MRKLMMYPFNKKVCEVARFRHLLEDYELVAVTSPKSYGYEGKDISFLDGGESSDIRITSCFEEDLDRCDCILFVKSIYEVELDFYIEKMKYATECGKEILITKGLKEEFRIKNMDLPLQVRLLGANSVKAERFNDCKKYLKEISVPIIIEFSMGEYCNGLDTELLLAEKLRKDGYKVSSFSSDDHADLFGINMLPDYMFEDNISVEDKIVNFNWYVQNIVDKEDADLLLIEVKEAIMPYSDRLLNNFGFLPYLVSNAVKADIGIVNLYHGVSDKDFFENIRNTGKYKYDIEVEYFNISNTKIVIDEFNALHPVSYISVDRDTVIASMNDFAKDLPLSLFHIMDEKSTTEAYQKILDELSGNPAVVQIW